MRSQLLIVSFAALLLGCGTGGAPEAQTPQANEAPPEPAVSTEWHEFDAETFRFRIPAGVESIPIQGTDSQVGLLEGAGFRIRFDFGWYSDDSFEGQGNSPGFSREDVVLGGVAAQLATYTLDNPSFHHVVAVYAPNVFNTAEDTPGKTSLFFVVEFENAAESAIAGEIARSITGWKKRN
ncbi:MAG: hypothetical protein ACI8QS_001586 [Planctomycetota bacterium]|jgi:hypothetical protein